jgi:hypothetical protein
MMEYLSYFERHGFMVRHKAIPEALIQAADIIDMKTRFLNSDNLIVFNQEDSHLISRDSAQRLQLITKQFGEVLRSDFSATQVELLVTCEENTVLIAGEILNSAGGLKSVETVLYSTDNADQRQRLHTDLPKTLKNKAVLAFVCLEPDTTIVMLRSSHKKNGDLGVDTFPGVFRLSVGDILLFHPNLIHAGDRYSRSNLRLHYYVMETAARWRIDTTYTLKLKISDKLEDILPEVAKVEKRKKCYREYCEKKDTTKGNRALAGSFNLARGHAKRRSQKKRRITINAKEKKSTA